MKFTLLPVLLGVLVLVPGCKRDQGSALQIALTVQTVPAGACIEVLAKNATTGAVVPTPAHINWRIDNFAYRVALFRNADTGDRVDLFGAVYEGAGCTGAVLQSGELRAVEFPSTGVETVILALQTHVVGGDDGGTDGGEDGGPGDGGTDGGEDGGPGDGGPGDGGPGDGGVDGGVDAGVPCGGPCAPQDCKVATCNTGTNQCEYPNAPRGTACDSANGRCSAEAVCVPWFQYAPGNFTPDAGMTLSDVTLGCHAVLDSSLSPGTRYVDWCGQPHPVEEWVTIGGGQSALLLSMGDFTMSGAGSELHIIGTQPVIFAVYGAATIQGSIDVSAQGLTPGPGGSSTNCGSSRGFGGSNQAGKGGGGGAGGGLGSFGGPGGAGGQGATGGFAGEAWTSNNLPFGLMGGCPGGAGGNSGPDGGAGGGAFQISSAERLAVSGRIVAAGGGGAPGAAALQGGSGGGSGGGLLLQGAPVDLNGAVLTANGGGGGQGRGDTAAACGAGANGSPTTGSPATGGSNGPCNGAAGGIGGAGMLDGGNGATANVGGGGDDDRSGGGGGGGVGIIQLNTQGACVVTGTNVLSPPANSHSTCTPP